MILDAGLLAQPFVKSCKPQNEHRIGVEHERFGVIKGTFVPLRYDGDDGITGLFRRFVERYQWEPESETDGGPIVSLHRGCCALTLEPGGQFEFSGAPWADLHQLERERLSHRNELITISEEMGIAWIASGFHPIATQEQLPWVPKLRYNIMRDYLPTQGADAIEMMRRTATVQANFDYESIDDGLRKVRLALRLSPIISGMFANGPIVEKRLYGGKSRRIQAWLNVDPARQGILPQLWSEKATLDNYIDWALDAPMFMIVRGKKAIHNTGQSFREFMNNGFQGHRPDYADWITHLNTLFPEVRLKHTIEVRGADSVPDRYASALPAIWTGLLYDKKSMNEIEEMTRDWTLEAATALRQRLGHDGMAAAFAGKTVAHWAQRTYDIASAGLERRALRDQEGRNETVYLAELRKLIERGASPADEIIESLQNGRSEIPPQTIVRLMAI